MATQTAAHGALRVWHIPSIPGKPFQMLVASVLEARLIVDALADYDNFLLERELREDFSNAAGLSVFDANDDTDSPEGSWVDWYSSDGDDFHEYSIERLRTEIVQWEDAARNT